ncbi:hypothetical protein TEA_029703 [Camellia sinensis var. sinensis]|uniref:DUF382 domain-containing protein n=1 Tax=Camellia sinensis var. sinensis TaxID=542762 RepID=A0A4S4EFR0_CAMSN|nr:hypothetical protein TEA_029703 [Camellia sinensis var. sinensis]
MTRMIAGKRYYGEGAENSEKAKRMIAGKRYYGEGAENSEKAKSKTRPISPSKTLTLPRRRSIEPDTKLNPSFKFSDNHQLSSKKKMTIEVPNGANGDVKHQNPSNPTAVKKSREVERRRRRRKQKKNNKASQQPNDTDTAAEEDGDNDDNADDIADPHKVIEQVEVEYVPEKAEFDGHLDEEFRKVFEKFNFKEIVGSEENDKKDETAADSASKKVDSDSEEEEQDTHQKEKGVSNKKKKLQRRMKIAELKQICSRPDVVEVWDATASDPKLLVFLKSYRNTVPVPRHWGAAVTIMEPGHVGVWQRGPLDGFSFNMFGKRGIEKQPFQLPDFIAATGIEKIRQAYIEKEDSKKLKQKQRERMQPKMGKMDIDYQVLHDAFFKYQTKPKLTAHGDLYHEGKEFESKPSGFDLFVRFCLDFAPICKVDFDFQAIWAAQGCFWTLIMLGKAKGDEAWDVITGTKRSSWYARRSSSPVAHKYAEIWPTTFLSTLENSWAECSSPIPLGASFGYHPGGWGKPPVDEYGRPLYGDVFGVQLQEQPNYEEEPVDKTKHWGDLEEEEEEDEEEDEEDVEEQIEEEELEAGIQSVDSLSSTPTGVETPDVIDLRKQQRKEPEKPLYQVLEEKEEKIAPGTLLGTSHTYVIGTGTQDKTAARRVDLLRGQKSDKVDVTLQPEELEVMDNVLHAKYEEAREEEKLRSQREDFSDMVAENEKKRKRKMQEKDGKSKKKDFKF